MRLNRKKLSNHSDIELARRLEGHSKPIRQPSFREIALKKDREEQRAKAQERLRQEAFKKIPQKNTIQKHLETS